MGTWNLYAVFIRFLVESLNFPIEEEVNRKSLTLRGKEESIFPFLISFWCPSVVIEEAFILESMRPFYPSWWPFALYTSYFWDLMRDNEDRNCL